MERPSNTTLALLGGVAALIILLAVFAATRNSDQDKLGDAASITAAAGDPDLGKACSGQLVYEQIKRALFRQAAQVRGSDQDAYEKISTAASVRMENEVAEGQEQGIIDCSGSLSIDLPPGVTTLAGRHMLMTDVYYGVVAMANGGNNKVVQLRNANALIDTLSTLTLSAQAPSPPPLTSPVAVHPADQAGGADPLAPIEQTPSAAPPAMGALPSFDCAKARTQSERSICDDPALAALDRAMASEYRRALAGASTDQAAALRQTRDRFLAYRDNCPNPSCIADSYTGRIREIRDIAAGRWQPQR